MMGMGKHINGTQAINTVNSIHQLDIPCLGGRIAADINNSGGAISRILSTLPGACRPGADQ
jgi:hypothetical protein